MVLCWLRSVLYERESDPSLIAKGGKSPKILKYPAHSSSPLPYSIYNDSPPLSFLSIHPPLHPRPTPPTRSPRASAFTHVLTVDRESVFRLFEDSTNTEVEVRSLSFYPHRHTIEAGFVGSFTFTPTTVELERVYGVQLMLFKYVIYQPHPANPIPLHLTPTRSDSTHSLLPLWNRSIEAKRGRWKGEEHDSY
ncbi:unnamed protein product [Lactuca saligna]|uniref:Uncharacterized protein n=1 Tax=Lactuca saligna TaxID=75948 RepID=A0AA35ZRS2_LACSI|nr:unnamed protein product [Lactuca saligna]